MQYLWYCYFYLYFIFCYYASFKMLSADHGSHREMNCRKASGYGPAYTAWPLRDEHQQRFLKIWDSGTVHFVRTPHKSVTFCSSGQFFSLFSKQFYCTSTLLNLIAQVNTDGLFEESALHVIQGAAVFLFIKLYTLTIALIYLSLYWKHTTCDNFICCLARKKKKLLSRLTFMGVF